LKNKSLEAVRLQEDAANDHSWRRWGPYVSERSWGTVREDYSSDGNAWGYFPHDHARSKAFRWGEDGLAGYCDRYQLMVFSLALWNGNDPILKERLFGVVPSEANHGEDVKEYYYYLDVTASNSAANTPNVSPADLETSTTLMNMARGYADSMISMFTRDENGNRPIYGNRAVMQSDPHWRDCLLFHEYFHADTGEGLGACHQTGWTGLVASLIDEWRR